MEIETIRDLTAQIQKAMDQLRGKIREQLDGIKPMDNVRVLGPRTASVGFQAIMNSPGHILAPSYYLPSVQADAVSNYLLKDGLNLNQIEERIKAMISSRSVVYDGEKIYLNPNTLWVLEDLQAKLQGV